MKNRMGVMKKFVLLAVFALLSTGVSMAEITPDEMLDPNYIMNNGYSITTAADALILQSRANGVEPINIEDKPYYKSPFVKAVRSVFIYLDPALEDNGRYHHDIKFTPTIHDL